MSQRCKITAYQLFAILFLSKIVTVLTYSPKLSETKGIWDFAISSIISCALTFIIILPAYFLSKKFPGSNMFSGKLGYFYIAIYSVYFLWLACYITSIFKLFITSVMSPEIPVLLIVFFAFIGGAYSAYKGIHAISRAATLIIVVIVISMVFILFSLVHKIETENYLPFMQNGMFETIGGLIYVVSRNFGLTVIAVLLSAVQGNKKVLLTTWNLTTHLFSVVVISIVMGTLGKYSETQPFPAYTSTRIAELGVFRRLDAVYIAIFVMAIFIAIAAFLYLFSYVCSNIKKQFPKEVCITIGIILALIVSIVIPHSQEFYYFIFNRWILLSYTGLTAFILPLIALIKNLSSESRVKKDEKSLITFN